VTLKDRQRLIQL